MGPLFSAVAGSQGGFGSTPVSLSDDGMELVSEVFREHSERAKNQSASLEKIRAPKESGNA